MQPEQLDQDAVRLAKAIRTKESNNNPYAMGASGERGYYQFMPDTWKGWAKQYIGDENAPLTPENQNKVAYSRIKEWKDQGYNPGQIASLWNSGSPDPTGKVGVNKYGVKYDTPSYVQGVYGEYQKLKGTNAPSLGTPTAYAAETEPTPQQPTTWRERLDSFFGGGKIGEAIGTKIAEYRATPEQKAAVAEFGSDTFKGPGKRELVGDAARVALNFTPVGRLAGGLQSRLASEGIKRGGSLISNVAVGAGTGYAFDAAESARQGDTALPQPGVGTLVGAAIPAAGPVLKGASNLINRGTRFGVSQATGLNPETISQIVKTPQAFSREAQANISRETLGKSVLRDIRNKGKEVSQLGQLYDPIRESGGFVTVPRDTIQQTLNKYGITLKNGKLVMGPESRPISKADAKNIEEFIGQYGKTLKLSPNAYLNAKQKLSEISKYSKIAPEGRTPVGTQLARDLRAAYEKIGDKQIPGLEKLDETYAPVRRELNALRKDYLDKDGNLKDSAINKIANLTGRGKDQVLARLEKIRPNIRQEIGILKAVEDIQNSSGIKVGTYTRAGLIGGPAILGNYPMALFNAIITQPEVAVPLIRQYGLAANQVKSLVQALRGFVQNQTAQGISPGDRLLNTKAGQQLEKSVIESAKNPSLGLSIKNVAQNEPPFQGFDDLSTKLLEKLKGKTRVSKQFISDLTNSPDLKQAERDLIRKALADEPASVNVSAFANKVKKELLPLTAESTRRAPNQAGGLRYESISLPDELRGNVARYDEKIYQSPISTSAGNVHFGHMGIGDADNYFAHSRVEDLAPSSYRAGEFAPAPGTLGDTRRVIELQSDLFQKGRLERETPNFNDVARKLGLEDERDKLMEVLQSGKITSVERLRLGEIESLVNEAISKNTNQLAKLQPYRNTWHERLIREEIKKAAQEGKSKLQFPTGETAMKIEGLGQGADNWEMRVDIGNGRSAAQNIDAEDLKVGLEVTQNGIDDWIITEVLDDGKFKAVPKDQLNNEAFSLFVGNDSKMYELMKQKKYIGEFNDYDMMQSLDKIKKDKDFVEPFRQMVMDSFAESFDISGKVDTSNPIYKFYEKEVGKYLRKYGAKRITDEQGVSWWEIPVTKEQAKLPVEAFAALPLLGAPAATKKDDREPVNIIK